MFSARNVQAVPGVKNFGVQGSSKNMPGVRVFKGPTHSSFTLNPFPTMTAHFDSFDVGYRPTQADLSQRLNGPPRGHSQQPQNWQTPANIYAPPPPHSYQQNSAPRNAQYGLHRSTSTSSRSQEPPRHVQPQSHSSNYSIHPDLTTDMFIYEASDAYSVSEYSPSPSPFSPALSTDSTVSMQSPSPFPPGPSNLRDRDGRNTPSLRSSTPAPSAAPPGSASGGRSYPPSSYSSNAGTGAFSFPSTDTRQAQTAPRGLFGSSAQNDRATDDPSRAFPPHASAPAPDPATLFRNRSRTFSGSASGNALPDSDMEFDRIARMNTAINAGYSYYYPEAIPPIPARSNSPSSAANNRRSPRDSLIFYNGVQPLQHSPDVNIPFPTQTAAPPAPASNQVPPRAEASSVPVVPAPPIGLSISNSSQSSEASILEAPSHSSRPSYPSSHTQPQPQSQTRPYPAGPLESAGTVPVTAIPPTYASVLSASPEPHIPETTSQVRVSNSSLAQSQSTASSTTLEGSDSGSSRGRAAVASSSGGAIADTSSTSNRGYSMPHGATAAEGRSLSNTPFTAAPDPLNISQSGSRSRSPPSANGVHTDRSSEMRAGERPDNTLPGSRTRRPSVTVSSPNNSPPRTHSQPNTDSQRVNAPPPPPAASSNVPAQQQPQTRVRKDSMSMGVTSSSTSRLTSRSYPNTTTSYPNTNIGSISTGHNGQNLASSSVAQHFPPKAQPAPTAFPSSAFPTRTRTPSGFPEPRRTHSDGDDPSLTDATRRSSVPFQTEFVPTVSNTASASVSASTSQPAGGSRSNTKTSELTRVPSQRPSNDPRPTPTRARSEDVPTQSRLAGTQGRPTIVVDTTQLRSVRWNEELICPSPVRPSQRRKGWFNRRGDQLWTNGGQFKSPPQGEQYPADLDGYPEYGQGWMNEEGVRIDMSHRLIPKPPLRSALKRTN